jgi:molybdenum cofactor synthesis domain-containing protein
MKNPSAAIIVIGNEILSGRTLDLNSQEIATTLIKLGINLIEIRTIADNQNMIVKTVQELSTNYSYIFTTGGIGPTHDDITAESIAIAFNLPYILNQQIYDILQNYYTQIGEKITPARKKMAYTPKSAKLLYNNVSLIPGFVTNNVFSLAGIPQVMKSMLTSAIPMLKTGKVIKSKSIKIIVRESQIAEPFKNLQRKYNNVDMGSYPFTENGIHGTTLLLRSTDYTTLNSAFEELNKICQKYIL